MSSSNTNTNRNTNTILDHNNNYYNVDKTTSTYSSSSHGLLCLPRDGNANAHYTITTKPGVHAQALSKSNGGTVTVIPTLNVLELNHERRVIHFDLLRHELLRQVILDLP